MVSPDVYSQNASNVWFQLNVSQTTVVHGSSPIENHQAVTRKLTWTGHHATSKMRTPMISRLRVDASKTKRVGTRVFGAAS